MRLLKYCLWAMGVLLVTGVVAHAQITFTDYAGPTTPVFEGGYALINITAGPDNNLWFTEGYAFGVPTSIGRITPAGVTTYFPVPSGSSEGGITAGPDGNVWFTGYRTNVIGRITPAGVVTEFAIPTSNAFAYSITLGPDGNLWFTESAANQIGRVTPDGAFTEFPVGANPITITAGPDGNLWYTLNTANKIGRITPDGVVTEFPIPTNNSVPMGITAGLDGNLWFAENNANKIGRITTTGVITEFPIPSAGSLPLFVTVGPDGNVWFTADVGSNIGRITPSGVITEFSVPGGGRLGGITKGPDNNLWFVAPVSNKIVKAQVPVMSRIGSFAQVASGGGWRTTMTLVNASIATVNARLTLYADDGSLLSLPLFFPLTGASSTNSSVNLTLLPNSSVVIASEGQNSSIAVGWADVSATGPLTGYSIFRLRSAGVPDSEGTVPLDTRLSSSFLLPFDNLNGFGTGIAMSNLAANAVTITATVFDQNGVQLSSAPIALPALGHKALFATEAFPPSVNKLGYIKFQSTGGITGVGLRFSPTGSFTSIPTIQ